MLVYLCAGFCGLPVFAPWTCAGPGVVLLPTFGYLLSFPAAAYLAGRLTGPKGRWLAAALALCAIYLTGVFWLVGWAWATSHPVSATWALFAGMLPFLPLDLLKVVAAVWSAGPIRRRLEIDRGGG
jgi:biotin transport system substrate-specific component